MYHKFQNVYLENKPCDHRVLGETLQTITIEINVTYPVKVPLGDICCMNI